MEAPGAAAAEGDPSAQPEVRAKLEGYAFFRDTLGSPRNIVAPMVDQSELAWRMLSRKYGADLCYTPMINSRVFMRDPSYRKTIFTTCKEDHPVIAQFCGNDPELILTAAKFLESEVDAVDLNFGCPQHIARRGHYGAYLQTDWDLTSRLVSTLHTGLKVPVTCKIRVYDDVAKSVEYAKMIERSGCQLLVVHGRTIKQKGTVTGMANWKVIKAVKDALSIPVVANGNILYAEDVQECIDQTGVDGVMTAEGNLTNPAIFRPEPHRVDELTDEYFALYEKYPASFSSLKAHLFRMWHACLKQYTDLRDRLGAARSLEEVVVVANDLKARLKAAEEENSAPAPGEQAIHDAWSGSRAVWPIWFCQPKVRTHVPRDQPGQPASQKQPRGTPGGQGATPPASASGTRGGGAEAAEAAGGITAEAAGGITLDAAPAGCGAKRDASAGAEGTTHEKRTKRRKPHYSQETKSERKAKLKWDMCTACGGNPMGKKCSFGLCKLCCRAACTKDILDCPGHKIYMKTPRKPYVNYKAKPEGAEEHNAVDTSTPAPAAVPAAAESGAPERPASSEHEHPASATA